MLMMSRKREKLIPVVPIPSYLAVLGDGSLSLARSRSASVTLICICIPQVASTIGLPTSPAGWSFASFERRVAKMALKAGSEKNGFRRWRWDRWEGGRGKEMGDPDSALEAC